MDEIKKQTRMNRRLHRKPGSGQTRLNVWNFPVCRTRTKPGVSAKGITTAAAWCRQDPMRWPILKDSMLKKGQLVAFTRPMSTMRQVLSSVEMGNGQIVSIMEDTRLRKGQVRSALHNLAYIGAIRLATDKQGRNHYEVPGSKISTGRVLLGVNSIFNAALPR